MIIVLVRVEAGADTIASLKDVMRTMERESRTEAGCQDYAFSTEIGNPTVLRVMERWDDMAALELHFATPHLAAFAAAIRERITTPMEIKVYQVASEITLPKLPGS